MKIAQQISLMATLKTRIEKAENRINTTTGCRGEITRDTQINRYEDFLWSMKQGYKVHDYDATPYLRRLKKHHMKILQERKRDNRPIK